MDLIFNHYLNFKDSIGFVEISEPVGFDQLNFTLEREGSEEGRNVFFIDKELRLTFLKNAFESTNIPLMLPNGETSNHLTHGFDYLVGELKRKGWESRIEYLVRWETNAFIFGKFDAFTAEIYDDRVIVSIIQDSNLEILKRNQTTFIDAFSDTKLVDGQYIQPCQTHNVLLKAKPLLQESSYEGLDPITHTFNGFSVSPVSGGGGGAYYYFDKKITKFNIDDTLINSVKFDQFQNFIPTGSLLNVRKEACLVRFNQRAENITVKIKGLFASFTNIGSASPPAISISLRYGAFYNNTWTSSTGSHDIQPLVYLTNGRNLTKTGDFTFNITAVNAGETIDLVCVVSDRSTGNGTSLTCQVDTILSLQSINITVNSIGVDIISPMVRLIDLAKHNIQSACNLPIFSDHFDVGGEHYDNFCFNGNMITGLGGYKFNNTPEAIFNALNVETKSGFQMLPNKIDHLKYSQFYENVKMAEFLELPDHKDTEDFNKKYFINLVNFKYDKSSFGRNANEKGTNDDVHTEAQFKFPSNEKDGVLNLDCKHIRSVYLIEEQKNKIIKDQTTNENDESLFIVDCVKATGTETNSFYRNLQCAGNNIFSDGSFIWTNLGLILGQSIEINNITVTITNITPNILSTSFVFPTANYYPLTFFYTYQNLDYVIRTNQDFAIINGINNSEKYSNLKYSIKRNLKNYFPMFATSNMYSIGKNIKNTVFRVNDKLETQLQTEGNLTIDKADIVDSNIRDLAILTPKILNKSVYANFDTVLQLFKDIRTVRGYVEVKNNKGEIVKGFISKANYLVTKGHLKLELEEKYNKYALNITSLYNGAIMINGNVYFNVSYSIYNNYVNLLDSNSVAIIEPTHFEAISINNTFYYDINSFLTKLIQII